MPDNESSQEQEQQLENDSKHGDSFKYLDDFIDFKLGDELCLEPENSNDKNYDENNEDDNIDIHMKKIMERVV